MATSVLGAVTLPKVIVLKSKYDNSRNLTAYFNGAHKAGSIAVGDEDVFSTLAKIEVERSTGSNSTYVHLRFSYFNLYWGRNPATGEIVGEIDQPEEDITKPTCTLFEPLPVDDSGTFYLRHVQSRGRVMLEGPILTFYSNGDPGYIDKRSYLTFVDMNTLVKLPPRWRSRGITASISVISQEACSSYPTIPTTKTPAS